MSTTQYGYFLIADITGYTSFLSKSELEHAQQTGDNGQVQAGGRFVE